MKETKVTCYQDVPVMEDKDGNEYTHSEMDDQAIFEAFDKELTFHGLELLVGDYGSNDYFFCVVKREES
jgi:hypothetical protein